MRLALGPNPARAAPREFHHGLLYDHGEPSGYFDVHNYIALCRDHYEKIGFGADYVKTLFR